VNRWSPLRALHPLAWGRRLVDLLGPTGEAARQSLTALVFNSSTSFVAGATLGAIIGRFEELPGLLVMVPAAIGLRGNIFGTFGNRISTAIHTGTFVPSIRRESVLGQNVAASMTLTMSMSFVLALVAAGAASVFGVEGSLSVTEMAFISILGGLLASVVVLAATIGLSLLSVRRGWDLDNLTAPTVSTLGDVITIPSLWLVSLLVGGGAWTEGVSWVLMALSVVVLVAALRSRLADLRRIVVESVPVLSVALALSTMAGLAVEKRLAIFAALPALLVLQPAFVSSTGSLGGILSSRVATNLHLGLVQPTMAPGREARRDALLVGLIGLPIYLLNGFGAHVVAGLMGLASPGLGWMLLTSLLGGLAVVLFVVALAYYGTIAAWKVDLDPDSVGLPVVTASVDFVGVITLIAVVLSLGYL